MSLNTSSEKTRRNNVSKEISKKTKEKRTEKREKRDSGMPAEFMRYSCVIDRYDTRKSWRDALTEVSLDSSLGISQVTILAYKYPCKI